jgi:hypothetical protein
MVAFLTHLRYTVLERERGSDACLQVQDVASANGYCSRRHGVSTSDNWQKTDHGSWPMTHSVSARESVNLLVETQGIESRKKSRS